MIGSPTAIHDSYLSWPGTPEPRLSVLHTEKFRQRRLSMYVKSCMQMLSIVAFVEYGVPGNIQGYYYSVCFILTALTLIGLEIRWGRDRQGVIPGVDQKLSVIYNLFQV